MLAACSDTKGFLTRRAFLVNGKQSSSASLRAFYGAISYRHGRRWVSSRIRFWRPSAVLATIVRSKCGQRVAIITNSSGKESQGVGNQNRRAPKIVPCRSGGRLNLAVILSLAGIFSLSDCGRRKEGVAELTKIQTAVHALNMLVAAGVTKQEYSQRFGDLLLKIGDLDQGLKQTVPHFPRAEQDTVKAVYAHLSQSVEAHKVAREYFGPKYNDIGCEEGCSRLVQSDYDEIRAKFPTLPNLEPAPPSVFAKSDSPAEYYRADMLQALWNVAKGEEAEAKTLIDKLQR